MEIPPELAALVASFDRKKAAGEIKFGYSGFKGSGFKFDHEEVCNIAACDYIRYF